MTIRRIAGLVTALLTLLAMIPLLAAPALGSHVTPVEHSGNPDCARFGYENELRIDPVSGGQHSGNGMTVEITLNNTDDGPTFDWSSSLPVDGVFAKGGKAGGNFYTYDPAEKGDTGLHAPANPNGDWAGLSHILFCWDDESTTTTTEATTTTTEATTTTTEATTTTTEATTTTTEATTTTTEATTTTTEATTTTTEASTTTTEQESTTTTEQESTTTTEQESTTTTEEEEVLGSTTSSTEGEVAESSTSTTEDQTEGTLPFTGMGSGGIAIAALVALVTGAGLVLLTRNSDESVIES